MTKPRRPHGRFETSLRGVANDARRSVAMTVILLPALSANVFALCKGVTPLQWIVVISLSMATVFLLSLYLKWRTIPIQASGFIPDTLTQDQLSRIRGLVTVVSSMDEALSTQGNLHGFDLGMPEDMVEQHRAEIDTLTRTTRLAVQLKDDMLSTIAWLSVVWVTRPISPLLIL